MRHFFRKAHGRFLSTLNCGLEVHVSSQSPRARGVDVRPLKTSAEVVGGLGALTCNRKPYDQKPSEIRFAAMKTVALTFPELVLLVGTRAMLVQRNT
jgi:hypothetical protein